MQQRLVLCLAVVVFLFGWGSALKLSILTKPGELSSCDADKAQLLRAELANVRLMAEEAIKELKGRGKDSFPFKWFISKALAVRETLQGFTKIYDMTAPEAITEWKADYWNDNFISPENIIIICPATKCAKDTDQSTALAGTFGDSREKASVWLFPAFWTPKRTYREGLQEIAGKYNLQFAFQAMTLMHEFWHCHNIGNKVDVKPGSYDFWINANWPMLKKIENANNYAAFAAWVTAKKDWSQDFCVPRNYEEAEEGQSVLVKRGADDADGEERCGGFPGKKSNTDFTKQREPSKDEMREMVTKAKQRAASLSRSPPRRAASARGARSLSRDSPRRSASVRGAGSRGVQRRRGGSM